MFLFRIKLCKDSCSQSESNLFDVRDQLELRLQAARPRFEVESLSAHQKLTKIPISNFFLEIEPTSNIVFSRRKNILPSCAL